MAEEFAVEQPGTLSRHVWETRYCYGPVDGGGDTGIRDTWRRVARALWRKLIRAAFDTAEPGVLFTDRVNRFNNLWYREHIGATDPCGEIPLRPTGPAIRVPSI